MMRECICHGCAEGEHSFKGYSLCIDCELYGNEDEFGEDKNGELCNECWLARQGDGPDEEPLRDPACGPDLDKDKL